MAVQTRPIRRRSTAKLPPPLRVAGSNGRPARPTQLREANCRTLLDLVRNNSPCSKADLVRLSGLTPPTVSIATAQLISQGLVEALGEGESSGGRRPSMLQFNAKHGFVAGADIGGTWLRMMLADLNARPVAQWSTQMTERQKSPRGVVTLLQAGLEEMRKKAGISGRVLHLTVGAPGITDVSRGVVRAAPNLAGWNDVPLRKLLERETGLPITVENDTNLAAVGEFAGGVASGVENFLFVALGTGVGAGIFLRGALHHGADWSAGEIGYLPVAGEARQPIRMREIGQLEATIGGAGIEAKWQQRLRRERRHPKAGLCDLRAPMIFDQAEAGDTRAQEVLRDTARLLADALGVLSLLYNPELIVLGGGVGSHHALCRETNACLRENEFAIPDLRSSSLGTEAQLHGAISLSLHAAEAELLC